MSTNNPFSDNNPYQTPQSPPPGPPQSPFQEGDQTGGVIPYKNPMALVAYYLGIVALLPCVGFPFGVASLVCGIMGLRARSRNPIIKGSVHAWIGIVLGTLSIIFYGGFMLVGIIAAIMGA